MRAVNLLPREETQARKLPPAPALVASGGSIVVAAFLAFSFLSAASTVDTRRQELAHARARLAAIPQPAAAPAVASKLPQERQDRIGVVATALGDRIAFDRLLREVSQVVPNDVWLQTLGARAPGVNVSGNAFSITGYTYSHEAVARFLARLQVVPDLSDVALESSERTTIGDHPVVQFTIHAGVRAGGAAS